MHALTLHYNTKQLLHLYKERKAHAVRKLNQNLLVIKMMAVIKEVKAILKSTILYVLLLLFWDMINEKYTKYMHILSIAIEENTKSFIFLQLELLFVWTV